MRNTAFVLRRAIVGATLLYLTSTVMAHAGGTAYVSPNGNDNNPGTLAQPYRTIQNCAATITSGGTCFVLAGDYQETVTPNSGITIMPYQNQTVTVDGTNPVTGWTLYSGNVYRAQVTLSGGDTNQVFVNGQMMTEAQWPLSYNLFQPVWATAQSGTTGTTLVDSNLPNVNWVGAHIHFWSGSDPWDPQTGVITQSQSGQLTFTADGASFPPYIVPQAGGYYFLFGALGALTAPSEWFYDSNAGYLYLWAPGGVDPNTLTISAKARQYGFDLSNTSNVSIQGLNLFATTINTNSSSSNNVINGITATYVSHFTTLPDLPGQQPHSYWYDHLGDSGIILNGTGNVLENSTISYSAGNGVTVYGTNITVQNNLIHHVDYMANYGSGIAVEGSGNVITQNTVHDTARFAIFAHSIFNFTVGASNLDISYNNLFDAMLISRDGGEFYTAGGSPCAASSTIRYNWLHDTQSLFTGPADNFALPGIYLDEDACGWQIYQNIVWNNEYDNIFIHGSTSGDTTPNDNQVTNNSIPDSSSTGFIFLQDVGVCGTTAVSNNYVLVPPVQTESACSLSNNSATAPGADMMAGITAGCNFNGCTLTLPAGLTVSETGTGNGQVTSSPAGIACSASSNQCAASFAAGTSVTLTASAATGSVFAGWSGGCSGTGTCAVTLNADAAVTANFTTVPSYMLSLAAAGTGLGTVTSNPSGINCGATCTASFLAGTQVVLTAVSGKFSVFAGWNGGGCSGVAPCTITLSANTAVTAAFVQDSQTNIVLATALLPVSRSVEVGTAATVFATIIDAGPGTASACSITPQTSLPAAFTFQTTDPTTNALSGTANTPVDISQGANQSFVIALTPSAAIAPTNVAFNFSCANAAAAAVLTGINTLELSASASPVPDIVALAASGDPGYADIPGATGTGDFAVATVNLGSAASITVTANTGAANLPVTLLVCQTDPTTGACNANPSASVTTTIAANATPTFAIFAIGSSAVSDSPGVNRIFVLFADSGGVLRGETSVAVRTQ